VDGVGHVRDRRLRRCATPTWTRRSLGPRSGTSSCFHGVTQRGHGQLGFAPCAVPRKSEADLGIRQPRPCQDISRAAPWKGPANPSWRVETFPEFFQEKKKRKRTCSTSCLPTGHPITPGLHRANAPERHLRGWASDALSPNEAKAEDEIRTMAHHVRRSRQGGFPFGFSSTALHPTTFDPRTTSRLASSPCDVGPSSRRLVARHGRGRRGARIEMRGRLPSRHLPPKTAANTTTNRAMELACDRDRNGQVTFGPGVSALSCRPRMPAGPNCQNASRRSRKLVQTPQGGGARLPSPGPTGGR